LTKQVLERTAADDSIARLLRDIALTPSPSRLQACHWSSRHAFSHDSHSHMWKAISGLVQNLNRVTVSGYWCTQQHSLR